MKMKSLCWKPAYYLLRKNKYFFIGCILGIILSSLFMPMLEDCSKPNSLLLSLNDDENDPESIQVLKLNRQDYHLFVRLEKWYREMADKDYNPRIHNKSTIINDENSNEFDMSNQQKSAINSMVRDKKLKFYRPRFHSIELNIKMKLLVCVVIRPQFLIELSLARNENQSKSDHYRQLIEHYINKTSELMLNDFSDNLLYFYPDISTGNINNSHIIIEYRANQILDVWSQSHYDRPFHVLIMDYLIEKRKLNEYAIILMMTESTSVHSFNLQQYLRILSVSDLVLSTSNDIPSSITEDSKLKFIATNFGHNDHILNHGLLISSTLISICDHDWSCYIDRIEQNNQHIGGNVYYWHKSFFNTQSLESISLNEQKILDSIFIYPVHFLSDMYNIIQTLITIDSINRLNLNIQTIEQRMISVTNSSSFDRFFKSRKPRNRYEINRWSYSNETHIFLPNDVQIIRQLNEDDLKQISQVKNQCLEWLNRHRPQLSVALQDLSIENLYQKFDAVRGHEYIVDLIVNQSESLPFKSSYRFQILKPLNPVELLTDIPPHANENLQLTMILPVRGHAEVSVAIGFLNHYANVFLKNPHHQTTLIIVLIFTRFITLNDSIDSSLEFEKKEFERLKKVSLYLKTKFQANSPRIIFMDIIPPDAAVYVADGSLNLTRKRFPSEISYLDLITRSLTAISSSEPMLLLHCRSNMIFTAELLNRVRVNTIPDNQIFIPLPFVQYRLRTNKSNQDFEQILRKHSTLDKKFNLSIRQLTMGEQSFKGIKSFMNYFDVHKDNGYFDDTNRQIISFYLHDYIRMRKQTETLMPIIRNRQSLVKYQHIYYDTQWDLYGLFIQYNNRISENNEKLMMMKAIEPDLKLFHTPILDDCDHFESNIPSYRSCFHRSLYGLGSKQKLAAIIYEFIQQTKL